LHTQTKRLVLVLLKAGEAVKKVLVSRNETSGKKVNKCISRQEVVTIKSEGINLLDLESSLNN